MDPDFDWPLPLSHRKGAPHNLEGIDVFYDFEWSSYFPDGRMQFRNGKCLAHQVLNDCPEGRRPALLLTGADDEKERSFHSASLFVLVINFPRYLKLATANAAVSYLARNFAPGVTSISAFDELGERTPEEIQALLDRQLTAEQVGEWAAGHVERINDLRAIISRVEGNGRASPANLKSVDSFLHDLASLGDEEIEQLKAVLRATSTSEFADFLSKHDVLPDDLVRSLDYRRRCLATEELEELLTEDSPEAPWQKWFEANPWVLGTEFVQILDERSIDVGHIADYLMQAYDGFVDLIEIKRPEGALKFWSDALDQPRCILIFGRSRNWNEAQREAYRMLNASYHNHSIMTFDHVLSRAKRMLNLPDDETFRVQKQDEKTRQGAPAAG